MKLPIYISFLCFSFALSQPLSGQNYYFPPLTGTTWDTTALQTLGWCPNKVDSLYAFLDATNTKSFIVLKNGRIVLEKYFGSFTRDSLWYWASAGKTLTAIAVGIAQQEGFLSINDSTSKYLGRGWTATTAAQEGKITIKNQLTMTTGLRDDVPNSACTLPSCLSFAANANTRWAYHNAPYTLLDTVVEAATRQSFNAYVNAKIRTKIGMNGFFAKLDYNNVNFSSARSMARFGLLLLNKGKWNNTVVLSDTAYFRQMTNSSQSINPSYGYLTWLNGKTAYMAPTSQTVFSGSYSPDAPAEMYAALGKNGQLINIIPSQGLVFIRMGNSPDNGLVPFTYNNEVWKRLNPILCNRVSTDENANGNFAEDFTFFPNPATNHSQLEFSAPITGFLMNSLGQVVLKITEQTPSLSIQELPNGVYFLKANGKKTKRLVIQND
jgi:CubicO group peptidase (beta-lactamase class C family)